MAKLKETSVTGDLTISGSTILGEDGLTPLAATTKQQLDAAIDAKELPDTEDLGSFAGGTQNIAAVINSRFITSITADTTFNFTSSTEIKWEMLITSTAGFEPIFQYNGVDVKLPDGYNISGNAVYLFSFVQFGSDAYVTERKF